MNSFCSFCYGRSEGGAILEVCAKCKHRKYCGRSCQIADWKQGHKQWCCKAGEIGVDYEIRESESKGLGLFALRTFEVGEKIMAERAIAQSDVHDLAPTVHAALLSLAPSSTNDLNVKFKRNAIGTGSSFPESEYHIFVSMSRVNHHCIGNTDHFYIAKHRVTILTAICRIDAAEEITFSYVDFVDHPEMYEFMHFIWKFHCHCSACTNAITMSKLNALKTLDEQMMSFGGAYQFDQAFTTGQELLGIYEDLHLSLNCFVRTYYDMFQIAISRKKTLNKARIYIRKAFDYAIKLYGDIDIPEVEQFRNLVKDPTQHMAYGLADNR